MKIKSPFKDKFFLGLFLLCILGTLVEADIKSTSGNINFDPNSDDSNDFSLSISGLKVGEGSASANLHVEGNAIIESGNLAIGTTTISSTLEVQGSLAFGVESVSANTTLSGNGLVFADSSSDNIILTLPSAVDMNGRIYTIKKVTNINELVVQASSNLFDSGNVGGRADSIFLSDEDSGFPYTSVYSDGRDWQITSASKKTVANLSNHLALWYRFDSSSGNVVVDSSFTGNTGILSDGLSFSSNGVSGPLSRGIEFDGDDDHIDTSDDTGSTTDGILSFADTEAYSLSLWYKGNDNEQNGDWGKTLLGRDNGDIWGNLVLRSGKVEFVHYDGSWQHNIISANTITDDNWHHIVYVNHTDITGDLYIDGDKQIDRESSNFDQARFFTIGSLMRGISGKYTSGNIDDVRIYERSLTHEEVQLLYEMGD